MTTRRSRHDGVRVLREMGLESQDIADRIGLSRATVKAYLREMGISPIRPRPTGYHRRRNAVTLEVQRLRIDNPHLSMVEIAGIVRVSHQRVKQILDKAGLRASRISRPRPVCTLCGKQKTVQQGMTPYNNGQCGACKAAARMVEKTCHSCGKVFLRRDYELKNQAAMRVRKGFPPQKRWFCTRTCLGSVVGKEYGGESLRKARARKRATR
jgi:transposase